MSETTISATRGALNRLTNTIGEPTSLTRNDIEHYLGSLDIDPGTRAGYLSWYRSFYRWALEQGYVTENPCEHIPRPRTPDRLPHPISEDDLALILNRTEGPEMTAWLVLGAYAGLRCKEIAGVRVRDLDFTARVLRVSAPKGHRERAVPMHDRVLGGLNAFGVPDAGFVFPHSRIPGVPVRAHTVSQKVGAWLRWHGINASAHSLRHRFGTQLYRVTKDLRLVQEMMGHRSPLTTAGYTQLDPGAAADGVSGL